MRRGQLVPGQLRPCQTKSESMALIRTRHLCRHRLIITVLTKKRGLYNERTVLVQGESGSSLNLRHQLQYLQLSIECISNSKATQQHLKKQKQKERTIEYLEGEKSHSSQPTPIKYDLTSSFRPPRLNRNQVWCCFSLPAHCCRFFHS